MCHAPPPPYHFASSIFRHSLSERERERERERDSFIKHKINHGHFFHCPFLSFFLPFFPYISDAKGFFSLVDWQILKYTMFVGIGIPIPKSKRKK